MFSKSAAPFPQIVSWVNSWPSMNSSTLTSGTCLIIACTEASSAAK